MRNKNRTKPVGSVEIGESGEHKRIAVRQYQNRDGWVLLRVEEYCPPEKLKQRMHELLMQQRVSDEKRGEVKRIVRLTEAWKER